MMMKRFATAVTPASQFGALHQELIQELGYGDFSEPLKECAQLCDQDFARNFAAQSAPNGSPWPPRKKQGSGKAGEKGQGHPLLIKTGELFLAATSPFGRGHIEDVGYRNVQIGVDLSEVPYARAQNYGYPQRNLPAREFADVSEQTADNCTEVMADWLEGAMAQ